MTPKDGEGVSRGPLPYGNAQSRVEFFAWPNRRERLFARIDEPAELAEHEVLGMHPVAEWTREALRAGLARGETTMRNGVRVRALHAQIAMRICAGVSTRTITCLVSELTAMLGANSRFQAGVRAARLARHRLTVVSSGVKWPA